MEAPEPEKSEIQNENELDDSLIKEELEDEFIEKKMKEFDKIINLDIMNKEIENEIAEFEIKDEESATKFKEKIKELGFKTEEKNLANRVYISSITSDFDGEKMYFHQPGLKTLYEYDREQKKSEFIVVEKPAINRSLEQADRTEIAAAGVRGSAEEGGHIDVHEQHHLDIVETPENQIEKVIAQIRLHQLF